ncbi:MAG: tetraacyldisaccharide 4'-kinase, partial [Pseudomonadota bacterium]
FWYSAKRSFLSYILQPIASVIFFFGRRRFRNKEAYYGKTPIICIGNATVGGTGKTPTAIYVAKILLSSGCKVIFLTKGYGGTLEGPELLTEEHNFKDTGDEPQILKSYAPVIVSKDRVAGANYADKLGYDVIIMDDGLQNHPSFYSDAKRSFGILIVDRQRGFGNGALIPAGPLREPYQTAINKVQSIFLIGAPEHPIPQPLQNCAKPVFFARKDTLKHGIDFSGERVIAFAAIGNPDQFFDMLEAAGCHILHKEVFPDHHIFSDRIIKRLIDMAEKEGAILVTTEKDMTRINPEFYPYLRPFLIEISLSDADAMSFEEKILDFMNNQQAVTDK